MKGDEAILNLPEVKDIPGQEHIHVPPLGELADTTISSDDEEGVGLLDNINGEEGENIRMGTSADLTSDEREVLRTDDDFISTKDEDRIYESALDNKDFDGEPLNEGGFVPDKTGRDLDIPGADLDNQNERIGDEDEENNPYSLGSDDNDANENRS